MSGQQLELDLARPFNVHTMLLQNLHRFPKPYETRDFGRNCHRVIWACSCGRMVGISGGWQ